MGVIGRLGDLKFEISEKKAVTFASLQEKFAYKIATHEVLNRPPVYEITGIEPSSTTLNLTFSVNRGINPREYVLKLNKLLEKKQMLPLITGDFYHGKFFIKSIEYLESSFDPKGNTWKVEVNLELIREGWL